MEIDRYWYVSCLMYCPGYESEASQGYQLVHSFDCMLESGPLVRPGGGSQEEESEEEGGSSPPEEDLHALLVKAWETKVFPVIQRRFRNDQERKSGLEQIKGALQLGEPLQCQPRSPGTRLLHKQLHAMSMFTGGFWCCVLQAWRA